MMVMKPTSSGMVKLSMSLDMTDPSIDPLWSAVLLKVRLKAQQINEVRELLNMLIADCDELVIEAIDDGERYRDIGKAAGRSMPWVQTTLRRMEVKGPRVRLMTARAAEAKRIADGEEPVWVEADPDFEALDEE